MKVSISVVMPIYNTAPYLERAVGSVMEQTAENWELILVDDGSTDGSGALCDRLAGEDARIRVLHLAQNGGLSRARNAGMAQASGKYLMFMDSDDWVEANLLELLESEITGAAPQMVVWGVTEEFYDGEGRLYQTRPVCVKPQILNSAMEIRRCALELEQKTLLGYAWNKLYDREMLERLSVSFEDTPLIEDILFNLDLLPALERVVVLEQTLSHYARRPSGSLTGRYLPDYYPLLMRRVQVMLEMYRGWGMEEEALKWLSHVYRRCVLSAIQRLYDPRAALKGRDRASFMKELFASELFETFRPYLGMGGGPAAILGKLLAGRWEKMCLLSGRVMFCVGKDFRRLFLRLAQSR